MPFMVVVLPVPGPPVKTKSPFFAAVETAILCCSSNLILCFSSILSIQSARLCAGDGGKFAIIFILSAILVSARKADGKNIKSLLSISQVLS